MPISSDGVDDTDSNEGPHCRNCHVGANNCYVCHSDDDRFATGTNRVDVSSAYTSTVGAVANQTTYASQSFLRQSASTTITVGEPCLDGGFSFPHRTLGANMLKDELYGIDFDGTLVAFGGSRTANTGSATRVTTGDTSPYTNVDADAFEMWTAEDRNSGSLSAAVRNDVATLENTAVENLDSVCIDCHGDATYYNGDDSAFYSLKAESTSTAGVYGFGDSEGWELLLKGLP